MLLSLPFDRCGDSDEVMYSWPYSRYLRPAMTGAHTTVQPYPCPPGVLTEHSRLGMVSVTPPWRAVAWSRPCRGLIKLRFEPAHSLLFSPLGFDKVSPKGPHVKGFITNLLSGDGGTFRCTKIGRVTSTFERNTGAPGFPFLCFLAVRGRQGVSCRPIV